MKKALAFTLAAVVAGGAAWANTSISTDLTFATNYIFRGIELGDETLHPSIEFSQDDYYLGFWGAFPTEHAYSPGRPDGWNNEYDFYVGYSPKLSDKVTLDVGVTYYYYTQAGLDDTTEAYVGVTGDLNGFTPGLYLYHDFDLENTTVQGNVGYSIPLTELGTSLDLSGSVGYVTVDQGDDYTYFGASIKAPYKVNENTTITLGLHYAHNDLDWGPGDFLYGTIGATVGF